MKKISAILLSLALLLAILPQQAMAAATSDFDQKFTQYLNEISVTRGFEVTREDISRSLSLYGLELKDFTTVEELQSILGEVIKSDASNLSYLYEIYNLDASKLEALLASNGEELNDYIFLNDLDFSLLFYTDDGIVTQEPEFDKNLTIYLETVSALRGYVVTKELLESILSEYNTGLKDFETVKDIGDFLGEVIKADLSNLDTYFKTYDLDKASVLKLLEEKEKSIDDYIYLDDLAFDVAYDSNTPAFDEEFLKNIFSSIGLTESELSNLEEYFTGLEDYLISDEVLDRLTGLQARITALGETVTGDTLTDDQKKEFEAIYKEYLSILKINLEFSLVKDNLETAVSFLELYDMTELDGYGLKIAIQSAEGKLLADMIITEDSFNLENLDMGSILEETAGELIEKVTEEADAFSETPQEVKTVKGGHLPKTASGYLNKVLVGLALVLAGSLLLLKTRKTGIKNTENTQTEL